MSDRDRTQDKDSTIKDKAQPHEMSADEATANDAFEPEREEIHGNGAATQFGNNAPGELEGGDRERFGIKPDDAMGAGR